MSDWQPIETAPKNGQILLAYYGFFLPVLITWVDRRATKKSETTGTWPFRKSKITERDESGWRVLILTRDLIYSVHGNFPPFQPTHWMPLPEPPEHE
jgi:hypothetical protein